MKSLFRKFVCYFSVFIFALIGLFYPAKATIFVRNNSDNSIDLIRFETEEDVRELKYFLTELKNIFERKILKHGYNKEVAYEKLWTSMAFEYIGKLITSTRVSKFFTNFILKDYTFYRSGLYKVRLGDIYTRVSKILDYIDDSEFIEMEMSVIEQ